MCACLINNVKLPYVASMPPVAENKGNYWCLDSIDGAKQIPIYGICVPSNSTGCLETDLLDSYGFPVNGQEDYSSMVNVIQKVSDRWNIPLHGDGKNWWEENKRAKMDKFIYTAFSNGFKVSGESPTLPKEPNVIKNIRQVLECV